MRKTLWISGAGAALAAAMVATSWAASMPLPDHQEFDAALQVPFKAAAKRPITLYFEYPGAAPGTPVAWQVDVLDAAGQVRRHWQGGTTLKARTAVLFKRPTKAFQDVVEGQGRYALLCIPNGIPLDGGVLLKAGEEIIGAVGVSGESDEEDGDIGRIGAAVMNR